MSFLGNAASLSLAVVLGLAGAWATNLEVHALQVAGLPENLLAAAVLSGEQVSGLSNSSNALAIGDCVGIATSVFGKSRSDTDRANLLRTCRDVADRVTTSMPSYSYGWLAGALFSAELGDRHGFNHRLRLSQLTGPNEAATAADRLRVTTRVPDLLDAATRAGDDHDVALLTQSSSGITLVASIYEIMPNQRKRISDLVANLPTRDQSRFIYAVRKLTSGAN